MISQLKPGFSPELYLDLLFTCSFANPHKNTHQEKKKQNTLITNKQKKKIMGINEANHFFNDRTHSF